MWICGTILGSLVVVGTLSVSFGSVKIVKRPFNCSVSLISCSGRITVSVKLALV
ncbi:leucine-rich repeat extensin-like protein 3 [Iris pallida]|uniref:Leucine-rich repeat extensin-like protein 3 n=1 Tax=Iris pallida TaxID=29817 RepID=A0AAX6II38_IRIPA|nr:leucine-rich repeat extensin-like protein 3 [Iris pallida]KAJ6852718.1 leucine-rich repeat extensin-like protein 3 [Iris pallida]